MKRSGRSNDETMSMKQSVVTLADAAGEDMSDVDLDNISMDELMDKFETGTEGRKKWKQRHNHGVTPLNLD